MTAPTPPLVAFSNNSVPDAEDLDALNQNVEHLYDFLQAGWRTAIPMVSVRTTRETRELPDNGVDGSLLQWDAADWDTDHMWSGVTSERIFIRQPGIYEAGLQVALVASPATANAILATRIVLNSTANLSANTISTHFAPVQAGAGAASACSTVTRLQAGDSLYFVAVQSSGQTVGIDPAFGGTRAWAIWRGPIP